MTTLDLDAINDRLHAILDDLADDVQSPERADAMIVDAFDNDEGVQLVFQLTNPFVWAQHHDLLDAWSLNARVGDRRWLLSLTRDEPAHVKAIATLDGMLDRALTRRGI